MKLLRFAALTAFVTVAAFYLGTMVAPLVNLKPSPAFLSAGEFQTPSTVNVEVPSSEGILRPLSVAVHEVTFGEWNICVKAGGCSHQARQKAGVSDDHPVSGVSWLDVQEYIAWVAAVTGDQYRLPLESEWRALAADVLDKDVAKLFDDPRMAWAADYANFGKRAERRTHPVGHYGLESNGVADLAGNVWEWTQTCWRSPTSNSTRESTDNCGGVRILAGAHMTYQSELIRVVPTGGCSIGFPPANIGFRLVKDVESSVEMASYSQRKSPLGPSKSITSITSIKAIKVWKMHNRKTMRQFGSAIAFSIVAATAWAEGDVTKGERVFKKCISCHAIEEGKNKLGPSLFGIHGRQAATVEGFRYSKPMAAAEFAWDDENLTGFLENPKKFMKGTKMSFAGIKKEADMMNLLAYLETIGAPSE